MRSRAKALRLPTQGKMPESGRERSIDKCYCEKLLFHLFVMNLKRTHYLFAGFAFLVAFFTYFMTMQPTIPSHSHFGPVAQFAADDPILGLRRIRCSGMGIAGSASAGFAAVDDHRADCYGAANDDRSCSQV
jgi:hypothetical protein